MRRLSLAVGVRPRTLMLSVTEIAPRCFHTSRDCDARGLRDAPVLPARPPA